MVETSAPKGAPPSFTNFCEFVQYPPERPTSKTETDEKPSGLKLLRHSPIISPFFSHRNERSPMQLARPLEHGGRAMAAAAARRLGGTYVLVPRDTSWRQRTWAGDRDHLSGIATPLASSTGDAS